MVLADTVGFIRHLPHDLVAAFKATLQETRDADLQLHVIDCVDERMADNMHQVQLVLKEIEADELPQLLIYNKLDAMTDGKPRIERDDLGKPVAVWLSALSGEGCELLQTALTELLLPGIAQVELCLPPEEGYLRSLLYKMRIIDAERHDENGEWRVRIRLPLSDWNRLLKQEGERLRAFIVT